MNGHDYLDGKRWADVTRTESYFCSELFRVIHADPARFLRILQRPIDLGLSGAGEWEVATEVCFYRDARKAFPHKPESNGYSPKRTFDLCMFGPTQVVIIEAKAQQEMPLAEAERAKQDAVDVASVLGLREPAKLVALVSSEYLENHCQNSREKPLHRFDTVLTWATLAVEYNSTIFGRADSIYQDNRNGAKRAIQPTV